MIHTVKCRVLTREEFIGLLDENTEESRKKIILHNMGLVYHITEYIGNRYNLDSTFDYDDMIMEGIIGMYKAIDKFDKSKNTTFATYAYMWVYRYIVNYIEKCSDSSKVKLKEKLRQKREEGMCNVDDGGMSDVDDDIDFMTLMEMLHGRHKYIVYVMFKYGMTLQEIGDNLGISRERVRQLRNVALNKLNKRLTFKGECHG